MRTLKRRDAADPRLANIGGRWYWVGAPVPHPTPVDSPPSFAIARLVRAQGAAGPLNGEKQSRRASQRWNSQPSIYRQVS